MALLVTDPELHMAPPLPRLCVPGLVLSGLSSLPSAVPEYPTEKRKKKKNLRRDLLWPRVSESAAMVFRTHGQYVIALGACGRRWLSTHFLTNQEGRERESERGGKR